MYDLSEKHKPYASFLLHPLVTAGKDSLCVHNVSLGSEWVMIQRFLHPFIAYEIIVHLLHYL